MVVRPESETDQVHIQRLTTAAFADAAHSDGSEAQIIDLLRQAGALTLSLVAEVEDRLVGHVAFSPVDWPGIGRWYGLGPVSVTPALQGQGVGSRLIDQGLEALRRDGAQGCVVLGDPAYYRRFGFVRDPRFTYPGAPPEYFTALAFGPVEGDGQVRYHRAFG